MPKKLTPLTMFYRNVMDFADVKRGTFHLRPSTTREGRFFILIPNMTTGIYVDRGTATALRDMLTASIREEKNNPVVEKVTYIQVTNVEGKTVDIPLPPGIKPDLVSARIVKR